MRPSRVTTLIWAGSAVVIATLVITLTRVPISQNDGPFYASIARSYHYGHPGVPSMLDAAAPTAIDHVRFYGPIYFRTLDLFFALFGVSMGALRALNLLGVLLFAAAGVAVSRALGGGPDRRAWTWLLLLLMPEAGFAASSGRMDSLAVGLEMAGLATLLTGLVHQRHPVRHGVGAGALFAAAALTTPRTFPFLLALVIAGIVEHFRAESPARAVRVIACSTLATGLSIFAIWTCFSSGGPLQWLRLMALVATHENLDVGLLQAASMRDLMLTWWQSITLAFSVAGALVAGYFMRERDPDALALAGSFALVATWTTLVLTMTLFNLTFIFGMYFLLPLTAVVIALPTPLSDVRRRGAAVVALLMFLLLAGVRGAKIVHAAITWDGRSPTALEAVIARAVPPHSRVLGPGPDFFFPVEHAGSRYLTFPQVSSGDWARWVHPEAQGRPVPLPQADFLIWRPRDGPVPAAIACPVDGAAARYVPPPPNIPRLAHLTETDPFAAYPPFVIYRLAPVRGCGR